MEEIQEITGRPGNNCPIKQSKVEFSNPSPLGGVLAVCDLFTILSVPLLSMIFTTASENPQKYLYFWILVAGCQRRRKNVPDGGVKVYQSG